MSTRLITGTVLLRGDGRRHSIRECLYLLLTSRSVDASTVNLSTNGSRGAGCRIPDYSHNLLSTVTYFLVVQW